MINLKYFSLILITGLFIGCSYFEDIKLSCDCLYRTIGKNLERYECSVNRDYKRDLKINTFFETFSDSGFNIKPIEFSENHIRYKMNEYYYLLNRTTLRYIYSVNDDDHYYQCEVVEGIE